MNILLILIAVFLREKSDTIVLTFPDNTDVYIEIGRHLLKHPEIAIEESNKEFGLIKTKPIQLDKYNWMIITFEVNNNVVSVQAFTKAKGGAEYGVNIDTGYSIITGDSEKKPKGAWKKLHEYLDGLKCEYSYLKKEK